MRSRQNCMEGQHRSSPFGLPAFLVVTHGVWGMGLRCTGLLFGIISHSFGYKTTQTLNRYQPYTLQQNLYVVCYASFCVCIDVHTCTESFMHLHVSVLLVLSTRTIMELIWDLGLIQMFHIVCAVQVGSDRA